MLRIIIYYPFTDPKGIIKIKAGSIIANKNFIAIMQADLKLSLSFCFLILVIVQAGHYKFIYGADHQLLDINFAPVSA